MFTYIIYTQRDTDIDMDIFAYIHTYTHIYDLGLSGKTIYVLYMI